MGVSPKDVFAADFRRFGTGGGAETDWTVERRTMRNRRSLREEYPDKSEAFAVRTASMAGLSRSVRSAFRRWVTSPVSEKPSAGGKVLRNQVRKGNAGLILRKEIVILPRFALAGQIVSDSALAHPLWPKH